MIMASRRSTMIQKNMVRAKSTVDIRRMARTRSTIPTKSTEEGWSMGTRWIALKNRDANGSVIFE
jgi:hypothetical protein